MFRTQAGVVASGFAHAMKNDMLVWSGGNRNDNLLGELLTLRF